MIRIDLDSQEPLIDQIVRGLREAIASGTLPPGSELPPVRQLANDLGVHWNTVARAYQNLQTCGLVHSARGRGTRVTGDVEQIGRDRESTRNHLAEQARRLLTDAKLTGLPRAEWESLWQAAVASVWPSLPKS
ncbi:MAG: GntR family transcriptional regulator [Planctomycetota bacterium]